MTQNEQLRQKAMASEISDGLGWGLGFGKYGFMLKPMTHQAVPFHAMSNRVHLLTIAFATDRRGLSLKPNLSSLISREAIRQSSAMTLPQLVVP